MERQDLLDSHLAELMKHGFSIGASKKALENSAYDVKSKTGNNDENAEDESEDLDTDNQRPISSKRMKLSQKKADKPVFKWQEGDMTNRPETKWNLPKPTLSTCDSPTTLFEKFMTDDLMKYICLQTLHYATSKSVNLQIDEEVLKRFLTILLISGYMPVPRRPMYWEMKEDSYNKAVSSLMSRNEFDKLMSNLHVADNANLDKKDRFAKVRPLVERLNKSCLDNFVPKQIISIDESMVPYFGGHGAKQYMKGKPTKFGYKIWTAASRLGYVIQFQLYQGAGTMQQDKTLGMGGSVVKELISDISCPLNCVYHIIFDTLFTSMPLLAHLHEHGYAPTGTSRANRLYGAPLLDVKEIEKKDRGYYSCASEENNAITICRWRDNKAVTVASTYSGSTPECFALRYCKEKMGKIALPMPKMIADYNYGMGGADRFDQNMAAYSINLRSKKWWWPFFRFILDLCVSNAHQLYRLQTDVQSLDLLSFRRSIVDTYLKRYRSNRCRRIMPASRQDVDRRVQGDVRYDEWNHWPTMGSQRRCALPGCSGTSKFFCEKFNVGLHPQCFVHFHNY